MARKRPRTEPRPASTRETLERLRSIDQNPRPIRRLANWPLGLQSVAEYVTHAPSWLARLTGRVNRYPKPFRRVTFVSADGTTLSAWLGYHTSKGSETKAGSHGPSEQREGIILIPGMFTSKDMTIQKARALKIFRDLGYHVLTMDLRGFGTSARVLNTGGWKESEDVEAAVAFFRKAVKISKVHIYAESLGAAAAIIASGRLGQHGRRLVDGSILAVGPYADLEQEIEHLESKSTIREDLYMVQWFFHRLLRLGGFKARNFREYIEKAASAYGLDRPGLYRNASPIHWVTSAKDPLLILSAGDDPVVPGTHGELFARALGDADNPVTWQLEWGSHCLFEMADPTWFWTVLGDFFEFYCVLPKEKPAPKP